MFIRDLLDCNPKKLGLLQFFHPGVGFPILMPGGGPGGPPREVLVKVGQTDLTWRLCVILDLYPAKRAGGGGGKFHCCLRGRNVWWSSVRSIICGNFSCQFWLVVDFFFLPLVRGTCSVSVELRRPLLLLYITFLLLAWLHSRLIHILFQPIYGGSSNSGINPWIGFEFLKARWKPDCKFVNGTAPIRIVQMLKIVQSKFETAPIVLFPGWLVSLQQDICFRERPLLSHPNLPLNSAGCYLCC